LRLRLVGIATTRGLPRGIRFDVLVRHLSQPSFNVG
jgi:hypothetical protein